MWFTVFLDRNSLRFVLYRLKLFDTFESSCFRCELQSQHRLQHKMKFKTNYNLLVGLTRFNRRIDIQQPARYRTPVLDMCDKNYFQFFFKSKVSVAYWITNCNWWTSFVVALQETATSSKGETLNGRHSVLERCITRSNEHGFLECF